VDRKTGSVIVVSEYEIHYDSR